MGGASSAAAGAGAAGAGAAGAGASSAASNAAAGAGTQGMAQQYMQKYGYNPYDMAGKYVQSAIDKVGEGVASQRFSYSPEMNRSVFTPYNFNMSSPQALNRQGGGMFAGTDFTNQAQRRIGI